METQSHTYWSRIHEAASKFKFATNSKTKPVFFNFIQRNRTPPLFAWKFHVYCGSVVSTRRCRYLWMLDMVTQPFIIKKKNAIPIYHKYRSIQATIYNEKRSVQKITPSFKNIWERKNHESWKGSWKSSVNQHSAWIKIMTFHQKSKQSISKVL